MKLLIRKNVFITINDIQTCTLFNERTHGLPDENRFVLRMLLSPPADVRNRQRLAGIDCTCGASIFGRLDILVHIHSWTMDNRLIK